MMIKDHDDHKECVANVVVAVLCCTDVIICNYAFLIVALCCNTFSSCFYIIVKILSQFHPCLTESSYIMHSRHHIATCF
jgi:hypothetical protein